MWVVRSSVTGSLTSLCAAWTHARAPHAMRRAVAFAKRGACAAFVATHSAPLVAIMIGVHGVAWSYGRQRT